MIIMIIVVITIIIIVIILIRDFFNARSHKKANIAF